MAKAKVNAEERNVKVKAKKNLKYDKDVIKKGQEFLMRESDVENDSDNYEFIGKLEKKPGNGADNNSDGDGNSGTGDGNGKQE
ncbi:hypothetical protein [Clostridium sp. YIM B02551]|uniref:hypothetical protein n=1 Tax=Clostridium sp. YIM B02551 TaxID=2910679 RepID=UPI001EEBC241|nr:hypothetical protein [Clostridium sp. YIM B02551]